MVRKSSLMLNIILKVLLAYLSYSRTECNTNRIPISRPENLSENGLKRLNKMRKANQEFNDCIQLLQQLRAVYELPKNREEMRVLYEDWLAMATASNIPEIVDFVCQEKEYSSYG